MPTQDPLKSPARRVIDRIVEERFTGVLRVSSHEASGELWFLAGILEEARFGVSKGDEALERLLRATQVVFQAELRLPHLNGGFKKPMPQAGTFAEARPVVLMRYCESFALTCSLELRGKDRTVRIAYRTGELLSADAASAGNEALAGMLESDEGNYEIVLPTFELPPDVNAAPAAASVPKLSLAERIDRSLSDQSADEDSAEPKTKTQRDAEAAAAEAKRKADEAAKAAETKRKADEAHAAETKRKADEAAAAALAKRKADEAAAAAAAETKRKADEAAKAAETKRKADEAAKAAETKRKADQAAAAEAKRKADEAAAAEAKREADQAAAAEAKRKADQAAEAAEAAEAAKAAEAKRKADETAAAEAKREADEVPAAKREASANEVGREESLAESEQESSDQPTLGARKGGFPWFWLFLAVLLVGLAYFTWERFALR